MKQFQTLMARDGHTFSAYLVNPTAKPRGAIVMVQDMFGLTAHIRHVADSYAADGYLSIAPALFDRVRRDVVLGYSAAEVEQGMGYRLQVPLSKALLDIAAATAVVRHAGNVALIGFCWGGTITWAAASSIKIAAAVCYDAARLLEQSPKMPSCPTQLHFGEQDANPSANELQQLRDRYPEGEYYVYPAPHAFANEDRPERYDAASAALARTRTDAFLAKHIG